MGPQARGIVGAGVGPDRSIRPRRRGEGGGAEQITQPHTGPARPHQAPHSRRRGPGSQAGGRAAMLQISRKEEQAGLPQLHPHRAGQNQPSKGGRWRARAASEAQRMP